MIADAMLCILGLAFLIIALAIIICLGRIGVWFFRKLTLGFTIGAYVFGLVLLCSTQHMVGRILLGSIFFIIAQWLFGPPKSATA